MSDLSADRPVNGFSPRTVHAIAAAWGFGEATLFFLVPDVFLSWVAVRSPRLAFLACLSALAGALAGGTVMFAYGSHDLDGALAVLERIPAIDEGMIASAGTQVRADGVWAALQGPGAGRPYKLYAVWAGGLHLSLAGFLLVSVPARLVRFVLVTALVAAISRMLAFWSLPVRQLIHLGSWTVFYGWYFWQLGI